MTALRILLRSATKTEQRSVASCMPIGRKSAKNKNKKNSVALPFASPLFFRVYLLEVPGSRIPDRSIGVLRHRNIFVQPEVTHDGNNVIINNQ